MKKSVSLAIAIIAIALLAGCENPLGDPNGNDPNSSPSPSPSSSPGASPSPSPDAGFDGLVFDDDLASGVSFVAFGGSTNDVGIDATEFQEGTASFKVVVPDSGYTGGALVIDSAIDLSEFNVLSFWAKASDAYTLNTAGLGNDSAGTTYQTERAGTIALTTEWAKYYIPIPLASKLTSVAGLMHFAEGAEAASYTIWFDEIRYETLDASDFENPVPAIATEDVDKIVGDEFDVNGTSLTIDIEGVSHTVSVAASYFTFESSDTDVATVDSAGVVTAVAVGTADVTASLGDVAANGTLSITVSAATEPDEAAPTPTEDEADVIALYSDAYTEETVDTWSAGWDNADVADEDIGGDNVKKYTNLGFAGIEFTSEPVDATGKTYFHIDLWAPAGTSFKIKLVDFGADGAYDGGDDVEHELTLDGSSTPAFATGDWLSYDIELADFTGLTTQAALAQMILSSDNVGTIYVDNIYFY